LPTEQKKRPLKEYVTEFSLSAENLCLPYFDPSIGSKAISFTLPKHKVSFVLGANGSGKSTLLKTLLGFINPRSGGCSTQGLSAQQRAAQIAWVDQSVATDIAYSVIDVVGMSGGSPTTIKEAMHNMGITHYAEKQFATLSGGEQRRVNLARAFAQNAPWLLLDEPTTHLDISHELELIERLSGLVLQNRSVFMATHNPAHIRAVPKDRQGLVLIMQQGHLAFQADAADETSWLPALCEALGITAEQLRRFLPDFIAN
jgi:iron complex transport system ATP-binding protein